MKSNQGFTLVEMLMVVMMVSTMATIGITAFGNYTTQARNAATKANLAILRNGVAALAATAQLECGVNADIWPPTSSINLNDITKFAAPDAAAICTTVQVVSVNTRQVAGGNGIPVNSWGQGNPVTGNKVYDCTAAPASGTGGSPGPAAGACDPVNHKNCGSGVAFAHTATADDGWCYDPTTGRLWANSENNGGVVGPPSTFESAF